MRTYFFLLFFSSIAICAEAPLQMISDNYFPIIDKEIELAWGHDAFIKSAGVRRAPAATEELPTLSAIMYDPEAPLAIVNGSTVGLNSMVGQREVIEIGSDYILLKKDSSIIEL